MKPTFNGEGRELYKFDLTEKQLAKLNSAGAQILARNSRLITKACRHVGGNPSSPLLDKTYMSNALAVREHNKAMGHDRDAGKAETSRLEREDEAKALDIHPIAWRKPAAKPPRLRVSWLDRVLFWIAKWQLPSEPDSGTGWRDWFGRK